MFNLIFFRKTYKVKFLIVSLFFGFVFAGIYTSKNMYEYAKFFKRTSIDEFTCMTEEMKKDEKNFKYFGKDENGKEWNIAKYGECESGQYYIDNIKDDYKKFIGFFLIFGLIPLLWEFLLTRLREVSKAIRGK